MGSSISRRRWRRNSSTFTRLQDIRDQLLPAIIQIPGVSGNTGDGVRGVKKSVEQAVGSDILFSN